jgi:hypothetical protein
VWEFRLDLEFSLDDRVLRCEWVLSYYFDQES